MPAGQEFESTGSGATLHTVALGTRLVVPPQAGERRRSPRVVPTSAPHIELSVVMDVGVLDLSASGVLLAYECPLGIGHRLQLHLLLGREPFVGWVEVRREEEMQSRAGQAPRFLAGAVFIALDETSKRTLQQFIPGRPPITV